MSLADKLKSTKSRAEAEQVLADANPTVQQMQAAAADLGLTVNGKKQEQARQLASRTGGRYDDYPALMNTTFRQ